MIWSNVINILVLQYCVLAQNSDDLTNIYRIFNTPNDTTTPSSGKKDCECVSFYLCTRDNEIITHGTTVIDVRY